MSWYDPFDVIDYPQKGYKAAGKEYEKGWDEAKGYMQPYNQAGMDQISKLLDAEGKLLDPAALQSEWASSYEMSPFAKQLQDEAMNKGLESAGSMGLLGSSAALNTLQQGSSNIMQKDRQNYMDDLMKKYLSGIGLGQSIYGTGAGTAGALGQGAMNFGQGMGNLAIGSNNAQMQMLMNMLAMAGKGAMV